MPITLSFTVSNPNNWGSPDQIQLIEKDIQAAADIWGAILVGSANFTVSLSLQNSAQIGSSNYLASAGPRDMLFQGPDGAQNYLAPSTQLSLVTNVNQNDGRNPDVGLNVNTDPIDQRRIWLDPTPGDRNPSDIPSTSVDFVSIATHELGHALGISGYRDWTTGQFSGPYELVFDTHVVLKNGLPYFSGPNVTAVYGADVPLAVGDMYHVGDFAPGGVLNGDLMFYASRGGTIETPSRLDAAIMADMGYGTTFNDVLKLPMGVSVANAGPGDDVVYSSKLNDALDGGLGVDRAVFSGKAADYAVSRSADVITVVDHVASRDASDTLTSVERLVFSDYSLDTTMAAKAAALPSATVDHLVELYVAYFNRVPEASGLSYWMTQSRNGESLTQISKDFFAAGVQFSAITGYTANMSNTDFTNLVYKNVLGRSGATAPNATELAYWDGQITSGATTKEGLIQTILSAAHAYKGDAQWGWVPDLLDNKIAFGEHHAIDLGVDYVSSDQAITQTVALVGLVTPTGYSSASASLGLDAAILLA